MSAWLNWIWILLLLFLCEDYFSWWCKFCASERKRKTDKKSEKIQKKIQFCPKTILSRCSVASQKVLFFLPQKNYFFIVQFSQSLVLFSSMTNSTWTEKSFWLSNFHFFKKSSERNLIKYYHNMKILSSFNKSKISMKKYIFDGKNQHV
jgi:hypothetical protein